MFVEAVLEIRPHVNTFNNIHIAPILQARSDLRRQRLARALRHKQRGGKGPKWFNTCVFGWRYGSRRSWMACRYTRQQEVASSLPLYILDIQAFEIFHGE